MTNVRVRIDVDVTIRVPHEITVDVNDDELLRGLPEPDVWKHDIGSADIAEVEVLAAVPEPHQVVGADD